MIRTTGFVLLSAVALSALAATGCAVRAETEPVGYAEVYSAPVGIETYPNTVYEGRPVYYYQNRWYYRNGNRWAYYHEEPRGLYDHRVRVWGHRPETRREERHEERREEHR